MRAGRASWSPDGAHVLVAWELVFAGLVAVDQALDGCAADEMLADDLLYVVRLDGPVPDVVGVNDDHGAEAALVEAAAFVDAHAASEGGFLCDCFLELAVDAPGVAVHPGAGVAVGADEDVLFEEVAGELRRRPLSGGI